MTDVAVTSFNLRVDTVNDGDNRWDLRKEFARDIIRELSPDILGTQEPTPRQVQFLDEQLPEYIRIGGGRYDGTSGSKGGEHTPLYIRTSRFAILGAGMFWLSATPEVPGSMGWDAAYPRVITWARLAERVGEGTGEPRTLMAINTHWDNKGEEARRQSALAAREWMLRQAPAEPIIFMGDLNSTDDMPHVKMFLDPAAKPVLVDAYRALHPLREKNEATLNRFTGIVEGSAIDFICHTTHFEAKSAVITRTSRNGRFPSDHYPLTATLAWK
jgi:endonuclease/exonuclease/phosphatase family metal-dependent hydrolase